ncbi:C-type lectin domain family 10 member A-like [Mytilus edulis]|uniref:C-type lectin domain family 10 member A-like n=1 Tax=Mytilus edulis TaxID=6550 RepID=UPI0039EFC9E1
MILSLVLLMVFLNELVSSIPCLSNESKKDFDVARKTLVKVQEDLLQSLKALKNNHKKTIKTLDKEIKNAITNMEKTIKMTTTTLEKQIGTSKDIFTNVEQKLKKLEEDFKVLGRDFQKTKWHKYNGHCYYYSQDRQDWFTAERKCREIGGYITKINDQEENRRIFQHRPNTNAHYWIGLTDLKEGEWRWSFDQSKAKYTTWISGYGSKGTGHNCVQIPNGHDGKWIDYLCSHQSNYVCESNFCF